MSYSYEFKNDSFGITRIVLPEKINIFADFIEDISTEKEADEYIGYVQKVLKGSFEDYEITLNATSVHVKKDLTIAEQHYRSEEPFDIQEKLRDI